jgi:hypothetical protein
MHLYQRYPFVLPTCQKCGIAVPFLRTLTKPRSNRIDALQKLVKWIENHSRDNAIAEVKALKQET